MIVKWLVYYGLAMGTQKSYKAATEFSKFFCMLMKLPLYQVMHTTLKKWSALQIFENNLLKQGQIKLDTLVLYLSGLCLYHVKYHLPPKIFNDPHLT